VRKRSRLLLVGLAAAITLGAIISTASANRIATSNQFFRVVWTELPFVGFVTIRCPVTIEGSFHSSTISKVTEALVGYVTRAAVGNPCPSGNGSARILTATLPWHMRYDSFEGPLPNITSIKLRLIGAAFEVTSSGVFCLFQSTVASPMKGVVNVEAGHAATTLRAEAAPIPLSSGSTILCNTSGRLGPEPGVVTLLGNTTPITVTLVQ
jgi:hypothetical protein